MRGQQGGSGERSLWERPGRGFHVSKSIMEWWRSRQTVVVFSFNQMMVEGVVIVGSLMM